MGKTYMWGHNIAVSCNGELEAGTRTDYTACWLNNQDNNESIDFRNSVSMKLRREAKGHVGTTTIKLFLHKIGHINKKYYDIIRSYFLDL